MKLDPTAEGPFGGLERAKYFLLFIAVSIFGFHIYDIFFVHTLHLDDHNRLVLGLTNEIHTTILQRNWIRAYVLFPLFKLLSVNPVWARLAQVVVFYIPLSFSFYYLYRRYGELSRTEATAAALLPCVLPGQWMIPSFIDGSYTVQGLLVFNLSLCASLHYLTRFDRLSWPWLTLSTVTYYASLEMMDHSVFLLPIALLLFSLSYAKRRHFAPFLALSLGFLVLGASKGVHAFLFPTVSASTTVSPTWDSFLSRSAGFSESVLPFSHGLDGVPFDPRIAVASFALIVAVALATGSQRDRIIVLTGLFMAFCSSVVFLTVSKFYAPRYYHIAGFGVCLALVRSLSAIVPRALQWKGRPSRLVAPLLGLLLAYSGTARTTGMIARHSRLNALHLGIVSELSHRDFPANAQIVVLEDGRLPIGGWWHYAVGYIVYATKRLDLTGMVGEEQHYYDPFRMDRRGFAAGDPMHGLDIRTPTYFFRLSACSEHNCYFKQYDHVLQYTAERWSLLRYDKGSGEHTTATSGQGKETFRAALRAKGIRIDEVLFAR